MIDLTGEEELTGGPSVGVTEEQVQEAQEDVSDVAMITKMQNVMHLDTHNIPEIIHDVARFSAIVRKSDLPEKDKDGILMPCLHIANFGKALKGFATDQLIGTAEQKLRSDIATLYQTVFVPSVKEALKHEQSKLQNEDEPIAADAADVAIDPVDAPPAEAAFRPAPTQLSAQQQDTIDRIDNRILALASSFAKTPHKRTLIRTTLNGTMSISLLGGAPDHDHHRRTN